MATKYQQYFKKKMAHHGVDDPGDIPHGKKDDFFNKVDKGWKAKKEEMTKAEYLIGTLDLLEQRNEPSTEDSE